MACLSFAVSSDKLLPAMRSGKPLLLPLQIFVDLTSNRPDLQQDVLQRLKDASAWGDPERYIPSTRDHLATRGVAAVQSFKPLMPTLRRQTLRRNGRRRSCNSRHTAEKKCSGNPTSYFSRL